MEMKIADHDLREVEARLDERMNLEQVEDNGRKINIIHKHFGARFLYEIERFVKDIDSSKSGGYEEYVTGYGRVRKIRELYLGMTYYKMINQWLKRYSDIYIYSVRVDAFYDACKKLGLIRKEVFQFNNQDDIDMASGAEYFRWFNALIDQVRIQLNAREFKESERLRLLNSERNEQKVLDLEEEMFSIKNGKSRWLVLSLTLRYNRRYRWRVTPEMIQMHRNRFFDARRNNKLMAGIKNYVWAIEQGEDTGMHMHVILFYSAESNHDEIIAMKIGEYWKNVVTEGNGAYWNSNARELKKYYARGRGVGVGQIDWNDDGARKALRTNLLYLAKEDQYIVARCMHERDLRTFGTGQVPKKLKSGRPRTELAPVINFCGSDCLKIDKLLEQ